MEQKFIKGLNTFRPSGYNLTLGGEGTTGRQWSEVALEKLRKSRIGRRAWIAGKHHSEEARAKIRQKALCRIVETRNKLRRAASKPVLVAGIVYASLEEASLASGINYSTLRWRFQTWNRTGQWPVGHAYLVDNHLVCERM
jgi:hypothetical protein